MSAPRIRDKKVKKGDVTVLTDIEIKPVKRIIVDEKNGPIRTI